MTRRSNSPTIWALVARCRPHLTASQLLLVGRVFVANPREAAKLVQSQLGDRPDGEVAKTVLAAARRIDRDGAKP